MDVKLSDKATTAHRSCYSFWPNWAKINATGTKKYNKVCAQRAQTSTKAKMSTKRDSNPDFRINPNSYPDVYWIASKMLFSSLVGISHFAECRDEMLSCRRETARCFVSLNISLSHSRSVKIIRNGTIRKLDYGFLFAFHSNYGYILYHFRDKARYWWKIAIFSYPLHSTPPLGGQRRNVAHRLGVSTRFHKVRS